MLVTFKKVYLSSDVMESVLCSTGKGPVDYDFCVTIEWVLEKVSVPSTPSINCAFACMCRYFLVYFFAEII